MRILGIETSCDETSIAVLSLIQPKLKLEAFTVASQTKLHARWGGVVPEVAARQHSQVIIPLLHHTLQQAGVQPAAIDVVAVTQGPGLITALQVGVETAKALAAAWCKPIIGVNHIAGHMVSPFLATSSWPLATRKMTWPAVALIVSGGHTELYLMSSITSWKLLGKTLDDAAGEAFDKVGKMLKLPYPGGPKVAQLAQQGRADAFDLPRPLLQNKNCDFSFAGLKTAVLYALQKENQKKLRTSGQVLVADMCASFQQAAIDVLVGKAVRAVQQTRAKSLIVSGGVSANQALRARLQRETEQQLKGVKLLFPELRFTGDNAAMIALAGALAVNSRKTLGKKGWAKLQANANWELWN